MLKTEQQEPPIVAFVSSNAWSIYNFRLDVIQSLQQKGYAITVIAGDDAYSILLKEAGCNFIAIDIDNRSKNPFNNIGVFLTLKKLYRLHRFHFIFHYVAKPCIYGSIAAGKYGIPSVAVVTGLGYPFMQRNWLYYLVKGLYTHAFKRATEIWFLNNEDARVFIEEKITRIEKVKVLPGEGVNTSHFHVKSKQIVQASDEVFTFLMSSRMLKSKGLFIYADAARILQKKKYVFRCELIGFFEKHHPDSITPQELNRWEAEGLIYYKGFAKDVRPFLQQADCLVFPSFYNEGVPRCLMEAACMELPIITSFNRGCKEVVLNDATGFICNTNDPFDLAKKMERMLNISKEERLRMGENGRALVIKKFSIEKVIQEYHTILER